MKRGTICVERSVNGKIVWLALTDQWQYEAWTGCFSVVVDLANDI